MAFPSPIQCTLLLVAYALLKLFKSDMEHLCPMIDARRTSPDLHLILHSVQPNLLYFLSYNIMIRSSLRPM
jgi:hypothetical protein